MRHLVIAHCAEAEVPARCLRQALKAQAQDPEQPRLLRVTSLDLDAGPELNRFKTLVGIGWHARPLLERLAVREGAPVDAVVEMCGCGRHHLLGLGRAGIPTLRWVPAAAEGRPDRVDALAAKEGSTVAGGSVAYTECLPGRTLPCVPLPEDEGEEAGGDAVAQRAARSILALLEAQLDPPARSQA